MEEKLARRTFIAGTAALGAVAAAPLLRSRLFRGSGARVDNKLAKDLIRVFRNKYSAQVVGREYLRHAPADAERAKLVSLIRDDDHGEAPPVSGGAQGLRQWVRTRQQKDFAEGHVVEVQGWILSATEARLCALSALT